LALLASCGSRENRKYRPALIMCQWKRCIRCKKRHIGNSFFSFFCDGGIQKKTNDKQQTKTTSKMNPIIILLFLLSCVSVIRFSTETST
jgi:hypothetical protein